jgi:hypothetical protein
LNSAVTAIVTIATAIIGLAIISVLVSKNANTAGLFAAGGGALAQDIGAAVAPVSGGGFALGGLGSFAGSNYGISP